MTLSVAYYSITFIICLFLISKTMANPEYLSEDRKEINRSFLILCFGFILWSISVVIVGVCQNKVLDTSFLFIKEFMKMGTIISGTEVCAAITNKTISNRKTRYRISSELLYTGVLTLVFVLYFNKGQIQRGPFGTYLVIGRNISLIVYILYYIVVIFFYATYTYMYYFACKNRREYHIAKQGTIVCFILVVSLTIEAFTYIEYGFFVPSMYVGVLISIILYNKLIYYKRSIEYHEADYSEILSPLHQKPAFVCDDEGKIIFENTRAFVMRQTYKDIYVGRYLTDVFEVTDYDVERLKEPRVTQLFDVYCRYPKEQKEAVLTVKHNVDKFGTIFATEVEVRFSEEMESYTNDAVADSLDSELEILSESSVNEIRTYNLIHLILVQKDLFEKEEKILFEFNLKGIEKASSVLGLTALDELCGRMQTELMYGEWESLNPMIIEMDRQYETLNIIYS